MTYEAVSRPKTKHQLLCCRFLPNTLNNRTYEKKEKKTKHDTDILPRANPVSFGQDILLQIYESHSLNFVYTCTRLSDFIIKINDAFKIINSYQATDFKKIS